MTNLKHASLFEALPARQVAALAGGDISYREAGAGPTIVFLHGLLGNADSWVRQFHALATDYRIVAWDAPGYGASDVRDPDLDLFVDALGELLRHLNADDITLVGHSMGGVVAATAATRSEMPIGRLVLSCTHAGYGEDPQSAPSPKLLDRIQDLKNLGAQAYARSRAKAMVAPNASQDVCDLAAQVAAQTRPDGLFSATRMLQFADARPLYAKINVPTLVLTGALDPVISPKMRTEILSLTSFAQQVDLPAVGHAPYLEDPETYTRTVRAFADQS